MGETRDKYVTLSNLTMNYTWRNIKKSINSSEFKLAALTWSIKFELPDGTYFVSVIQHYFNYIIKRT